MSRFKFVRLEDVEKAEMEQLDRFLDVTRQLSESLTSHAHHPMVGVARLVRSRGYLRDVGTDGKSLSADDVCKVGRFWHIRRTRCTLLTTLPHLV